MQRGTLPRVTTPQDERDAARAAYLKAREEFDAAELAWDPFLDTTGDAESDPLAAEAAFDRLKRANDARQDALDSLWVAWRNRPGERDSAGEREHAGANESANGGANESATAD